MAQLHKTHWPISGCAARSLRYTWVNQAQASDPSEYGHRRFSPTHARSVCLPSAHRSGRGLRPGGVEHRVEASKKSWKCF